MDVKKIDLTSTLLEKGFDSAKSFLGKLIMPAVEETGLLLKDQVTMWKFNNQVRMLNKAKLNCEKNNISPKTISLKLLCPLLDYSGLEEDEFLHDKWAILLSNMVDSEQNIENHVFPYILSQLSSQEFFILEKVYDVKVLRVERLQLELQEHKLEQPLLQKTLEKKINKMNSKIEKLRSKSKDVFTKELWELESEKRNFLSELKTLEEKGNNIYQLIKKTEIVPENSFKEYELSNTIRLGLVKEEKEFFANSQTLEIPNESDSYRSRSYTNVDLDIEVDSNTEHILTELGELFFNACRDKQNKKVVKY